MLSRIVMVAALMASAGCHEGDDCRAGKTRCRGETVEVCDASGNWVDIANCMNVTASEEPSWLCCPVEDQGDAGAVHACLPRSECAEAAR
jgi:hypothetical protein